MYSHTAIGETLRRVAAAQRRLAATEERRVIALADTLVPPDINDSARGRHRIGRQYPHEPADRHDESYTAVAGLGSNFPGADQGSRT